MASGGQHQPPATLHLGLTISDHIRSQKSREDAKVRHGASSPIELPANPRTPSTAAGDSLGLQMLLSVSCVFIFPSEHVGATTIFILLQLNK